MDNLPMRLSFTKMQGAGNDFVVLDGRAGLPASVFTADVLRRLADRRLGVGADQILVVERPSLAADEAQFIYRIFNADGSEVEQCGNGARCFARFVLDRGLVEGPEIRVRTRSGLITLRVEPNGEVRVDMGRPSLLASSLPFRTDGLESKKVGSHEVYGLPLSDGRLVWVAPVSMGNPHLVQWVSDVNTCAIDEDGPLIESHARLPHRVNAGFAQRIDAGQIALRVFERGAGETLACGTGACAAVVSGIAQGLLSASTPVCVHARGGDLRIEWSGKVSDPVFMSGPATTVFEGEINL